MPFGLTNAPAVFQALVNDILRDMLNKFVFVYLDDILIFSKTQSEHVHHVQSVLRRLLENSLYVKAEKCEFHVRTTSFLGFIVAEGHIQMDPAEVSAVSSWPIPESRKKLQQFLGFANFYRRFIRGYSAVAAPLTSLTSTKRPFEWTPAADRAFQSLKARFTSAPILRMPDEECPPLPIPMRPWSHVALDFVSGLPPSDGNTVILTIVDRFSKMAHFIPLPKLPSAKETAQIVLEQVFRIHGLPKDIVSDRGPQFASSFWKEFCHLLGATASLTSGFHPQSNGQAERINQELEKALRCMASRNPRAWAQHLLWIEYAHNSLTSTATGLSPFQCVYGYQPPLFASQEGNITCPSALAYARRCRRTWYELTIMDPAGEHSNMETSPEPSALEHLGRAESDMRRMTSDIASLVRLGHQHQQQVQQQQQRILGQEQQLAQVIQLLTQLTTPSAPVSPDPSIPDPGSQGSNIQVPLQPVSVLRWRRSSRHHVSSKSRSSPGVGEIRVSSTILQSPPIRKTLLQVHLRLPNTSHTLAALVDSGAT
uniref:ribonuclease H n=1 Tax=Larimichthys crocea TaxID=215358 RepID=A0A0F8AN84_LARCR